MTQDAVFAIYYFEDAPHEYAQYVSEISDAIDGDDDIPDYILVLTNGANTELDALAESFIQGKDTSHPIMTGNGCKLYFVWD